MAETFHVGAAPDAPVVPAAGSAPVRAAYAECATAGGRVPRRSVARRPDRASGRCCPSRAGWAGGARWFRCDVAQASLDGSSDTSRTGSLAGALAGAVAAAAWAASTPTVNADAVRTMIAGGLHGAARRRVRRAVDRARTSRTPSWPPTGPQRRRAAAARSPEFTGVPDDDDVQFRTGWISYNPTRGEWQQGERRVRCFLWFRDRTLTRSLAGAGPSVLPVG